MIKFVSRFAVPLIAMVLLGLSVALAVSLKNAQGTNVTNKIGLTQRLGEKIPLDAYFRDEKGNPVMLGDYFGKRPVLLMLVFYSCQGACQLEFESATQSFKDIPDKDIGKDYEVVSISINSKETAELANDKKNDVLRSYSRPGAYDGWHFLTGDQTQIKRVADAIGYKYYYNAQKDQILHPTGLLALTPDGRISRYLYGVDYAGAVVGDSLTTAKKGEINVPSDPVLFGCFQYDPKTGKTRLNVFRALQISGIATILIMATSIFLMSRGGPRTKLVKKEDQFQPWS